MRTPVQAFMAWYHSLTPGHRQSLAHMFIVLTTQNTSDLAMARDLSQERFESHVLERDFPVRVVARMVVVRAVFDFIFINRDQLVTERPGPSAVVDISIKQWERGLESWTRLRRVELSDVYIQLWLKIELNQVEP